MIYDYQGREIGLEEKVEKSLEYPVARNQQKWDKFHLDYVLQVGEVVGFKRPQSNKLTKPERKVFERVFREYHTQPLLQEVFGTYENFFHCFLVEPYGVGYFDGGYRDKLPSLENKLRDQSKESDRNELKEEVKLIEFIRKINLPVLLYESLESYTKKKKQRFRKELRIAYTDQERETGTQLRAGFGSILWEDVFDSLGDCIFITLGRKEGAVFQKYWFASLLHAVHPKIHYLNFTTPSEEIPPPLFRIKLMEAENESGEKSLIVGGVLGENIKKIKSKGAATYLDDTIRFFFEKNYTKKDRLFYNLNHLPGEDKPYNQFMEFIRKKHSVSERKLKAAGEVKGKKCTHKLSVRWERYVISRISNWDEKGTDKFNGEQYSETFEPNQKKEALGAFVTLDGLVRGFDLPYRKVKSSWKRKAAYGLLGCFLVISADSIMGYYAIVLDQELRTREYQMQTMVGEFEEGRFQSRVYKTTRKVVVSEIDSPFTEPDSSVEEMFKGIRDNLQSLCDSVNLDKDSGNFGDVSAKELVCSGDSKRSSFLPAGLHINTWQLLCPHNTLSMINNYANFYRGEEKPRLSWELGEDIAAVPFWEISRVQAIRIEGYPLFIPSVPFIYQPRLVRNFEPALEITTEDGKKYFINGSARLSFIAKVPKIIQLGGWLSAFIKNKDKINFEEEPNEPYYQRWLEWKKKRGRK